MIEVYTDAACNGDPGMSAAGIIIKNNQQIEAHQFSLGIWTNHEAEFHAIIRALDLCKDKYPGQIISVRSDSKIAVDTLDNQHTKNEKFLPLLQKVLELEKKFSYVFYKWIPEKQNKNADKLAKDCLQAAQSPDQP